MGIIDLTIFQFISPRVIGNTRFVMVQYANHFILTLIHSISLIFFSLWLIDIVNNSIILYMANDSLLVRKATKEDVAQIANVLLDFYNMNDHEEAEKAFKDELKKELI